MYCQDRGDRQNAYGITVYGDGVYSDHKADIGTRNAFFIEDSTFYNCSHTVSEFCDGFLVFRNNNVVNSDSYLDIHGPGYNYCPFNEGETDHGGGGFEAYGNTLDTTHTWGIAPRAGNAGIITDNNCVGDGYNRCVSLQIDSICCQSGSKCGDGSGETTDRSILKNSTGCRQAPENWYIWNNT